MTENKNILTIAGSPALVFHRLRNKHFALPNPILTRQSPYNFLHLNSSWNMNQKSLKAA